MDSDQVQRKIIHVDMDAFYASIEQRDDPNLQGKPVAVGGSKSRGVVAAASYEARAYGVRSAMPSARAYRLCPNIVFVRPRFEHYGKISRQIRQIFFRYTDLVEPLSLDEAYLDVSTNKLGIPSATRIAKQIKIEIKKETGLTASAGISINKFLAKVASDIHKPDGLTLIPPDRAEAFLEKLAIEKFHGIGKVTAKKMKRMGIHNGKDLKQYAEHELVQRFGKVGRHYFRIVRAQDQRKVQPDRLRKSVGAENTFSQDLTGSEEMLAELVPITQKVCERLEKIDTQSRTITLKIKYHDFVINTRSKTISQFIQTYEELFPIVTHLLHHPNLPHKPVRLLGVTASNLDNDKDEGQGYQLTLEF